MSRRRLASAGWRQWAVLVVALVTSCTQDFDAFEIGGTDAGGATTGAGGTLGGGPATGGTGAAATGGGGAGGGDASPEAPATGGTAGFSGAAGSPDADTTDAGDADSADGSVCPSGSKLCEGACVATSQPAFGCAAASCAPCVLRNATATCSAEGTCAVGQCDEGFADCDGNVLNGCEADKELDPQNCGGCGAPCVLPHVPPSCVSGECVMLACEAGYSDCDGDPTTGCERATATDPTACGACTNNCRLSPGEWLCVAGACQESLCPSALGDCDNAPANGCETALDTPENCGGCGRACQLPHATARCVDAECAVGSCEAGFADCDGLAGNGCEANLAQNTNHCGACNAPCSSESNTSATCSLGVCRYTCLPGFADCNGPQPGSSDDGCESNVATPTSCGVCGRQCSQNQVCSSGQCACQSGFAECDGQAQTVCETDVSSSAENCGQCARSCGANASCSAGVCRCQGSFADCDLNLTNGCETDLRASAQHCGSCGTSCSSTNGTASCANGACSIACNLGFASCDGNVNNGCETNTNASTLHCGGCGNTCSSTNGGASCTGGTCFLTCSSGFGNCDSNVNNGCETTLATSLAHCGACNRACTGESGTATCTLGTCAVTCNPGFGNCDADPYNGCEANFATSLLACGACGATCGSANGSAVCSSGDCFLQCNLGFGNCNNDFSDGCETSTSNNASHCGGCRKVCSATNGAASCTGGSCNITCYPGFGNCDGNVNNGCETPLDTVANCGACANACSSQGGTPTCFAGQCSDIICNLGFGNCDGDLNNGCETRLDTLTNCGACANACGSTNGVASCTFGSCSIACNAGFGNCDGSLNNGCETSLDTLQNCGACGNFCSSTSGTASCTSGQCTIACSGNTANCDGDPSNGCETDTRTSTAHCGGCNRLCSAANASAACTNGTCAYACNSGFSDCDADLATGCEVNTLTNPSHCGGCRSACNTANGTATCSAGSCSITCNSGFANCDGSLLTGCETNTLTHSSHCGGCAKPCSANNGTATCSAGSCAITCSPSFGNCDGTVANGCETSLLPSSQNCGFCGNACGANAACSNGACICTSGFSNCDGNQANGCEVELANDSAHCSACGKACGAGATCTAGTCRCASAAETCMQNGSHYASASCAGDNCVLSCTPGFADCDGNSSNGCETDLASNAQNCSGCGNLCAAGAACSSGVCKCGVSGETCLPTGSNYATASCSGAECVLGCSTGFADCDSQAGNGCEVNTQTSAAHCGACAKACAANQACSAGSCVCAVGFTNCDGQAANGCEARLASDVQNCGACGRVCNNQNVSSRVCAAGVCTSSCNAGFANCNQPVTGSDDGCERDVRTNDTSCGGCNNSCTAQNGQLCGQDPTPDGRCGCGSNDAVCRAGTLLAACGDTGVCVCVGGQTLAQICRSGEVCIPDGQAAECSCNGGAACTGNQICCQTPAGCANVDADPQNCGACGHACPPGFGCTSGRCLCTASAQCNAGSFGTCNTSSGVCVCSGNTCAAGKRCQANGSCD